MRKDIKEIRKQLRKENEIYCMDLSSYLITLQEAIRLGFECKAKIIKGYETK